LFPVKDAIAGKVVLYSSNKQEAIDLAVQMFKKKHSDISVSVVRAGSGALMKRIAAEKDNPLGDVFWSGGFGTLGAYKDNFQPYASPEAKGLKPEFIEPNNLWTGVNVHPMVIMYNSKFVNKEELPTKWSDLFDLKWKGKVVMGDPVKSSSTYIQAYGYNKLYGKEGLEKLAQVVKNVPSTSMVYKGVAMGEYALGITMEYAAYSYIAGGQKEIGIIYPEDGSFLSPEGVVLIKGAKNDAEAKLLYDFFCSKEAQEALFVKSFRRPTRGDIEVEKLTKLPSMSSIKYIDIDQAKAAADHPTLTETWGEIKRKYR
jgi:iron(III) transport system substrate-binding protein